MTLTEVGALVFGAVIGFITYRTLVRVGDKAAITDLAAVAGAIGGGVVTKLYDPSGRPFAWYAIGLGAGMVVFFAAYWAMNGKAALAKVMSGDTLVIGAPAVRGPASGGPQA
jgi:hypothetical protein